jgi:hypothetical protein
MSSFYALVVLADCWGIQILTIRYFNRFAVFLGHPVEKDVNNIYAAQFSAWRSINLINRRYVWNKKTSTTLCLQKCLKSFCITRLKLIRFFRKWYQFPVRNTKWLKNGKLRRAILCAFYNTAKRNFGILLIFCCSFKLW